MVSLKRQFVSLDSRFRGNGMDGKGNTRPRTTPTEVGVQLILCRLEGGSFLCPLGSCFRRNGLGCN